ncbi:MAG: tetraacyldisaccharide 4'-kinase [Bacteroidales bacterium]
MTFIKILFIPFGFLYGFIGWLRNIAFDIGLLPSESYNVPVISVGNLNMGGTGKTPHVEYLVRLLQDKYKIATLSRGYRRKTSGFFLAGNEASAETIGDEPLQYWRKFPGIIVAVCENRREGIKKLLELHPETEVILLDDAFQHRYVKPGLSILLTDYHKPFTADHIFPFGKLREFRSGYKRADIVVVTKTPKIFSPITRRSMTEEIKPVHHQRLYFSYLKYMTPMSLDPMNFIHCKSSYNEVLMVTGIANPDPLEIHLKESGFFNELHPMIFPDHHLFTDKDVKKISESFHNIVTKNKVMITTEKDAMRLRDPALAHLLEDIPVYYFPVEVEIHKTDKTSFDQLVLDYVKKNKRNL